MQLYVKCAWCGGDGRQMVDLPCGCCDETEECEACDGEGYVEYEPE